MRSGSLTTVCVSRIRRNRPNVDWASYSRRLSLRACRHSSASRLSRRSATRSLQIESTRSSPIHRREHSERCLLLSNGYLRIMSIIIQKNILRRGPSRLFVVRASGIFKKDNDRVILRLLRSLIFRSQKAKNFHHINFIFLCIVLSSSKCLAIVLARDSSLLIYLPATKLVQILLPLFIYQFATYRMPHATGHTIIPIGSRCNILWLSLVAVS